jgi:hypothetical protein
MESRFRIMPMSPKTSISTGSTQGEIRCMALCLAAMMWGAGIGIGDHRGMGLLQAASDAAVAVLCGSASWLTYHIIGRQNNGLIMIAFYLPMVREDPTETCDAILATFLPVALALGGFFGLIARGLEALKARKRAPVLPGPL